MSGPERTSNWPSGGATYPRAVTRTTDEPTGARELHPARQPSFRRFITTGALVGMVIGVWVSLSGVLENPERIPQGYNYTETTSAGYLGLFGAFLGALLAAVVAVLLDRRPR